jgi:two-component system NarL family response regulator
MEAHLTQKELLVLGHAASGLSIKETATEMHYSPETVKTFRKSILNKLMAKNMVHAVHLAHTQGLIGEEKYDEENPGWTVLVRRPSA